MTTDNTDRPRSTLRFETLADHAGQAPAPTTGAIMPAIYQASTYVERDVGVHEGHEHARTADPTCSALSARDIYPGLADRGINRSFAGSVGVRRRRPVLAIPQCSVLRRRDAFAPWDFSRSLLTSHPHYNLARRQMRAPGGMISVVLDADLEATHRFVASTRVFSLAWSLGGVESFIKIPAAMTHAAMPAEQRRAIGVADGLIRLSVGVEHVDDLIRDPENAFAVL